MPVVVDRSPPRQLVLIPGVVVSAYEATVRIDAIPAVRRLRERAGALLLAAQHEAAPLYPASPVVCYVTDCGLGCLSDVTLIEPELRAADSATIRVLIVDVESLKPEVEAQVRAYFAFVVAARHSLPPREAFRALTESSALRRYVTDALGVRDATSYQAAVALYPTLKRATVQRYRKRLGLVATQRKARRRRRGVSAGRRKQTMAGTSAVQDGSASPEQGNLDFGDGGG